MYIHKKARLPESLQSLAPEIAQRSGWKNIFLDTFIISATPYDTLYQHYENGTMTKKDFTERHILFFERSKEYDYLQILFGLNEMDAGQ